MSASVVVTEWDKEHEEVVTIERVIHNGRVIDLPYEAPDAEYVQVKTDGYEPVVAAKVEKVACDLDADGNLVWTGSVLTVSTARYEERPDWNATEPEAEFVGYESLAAKDAPVFPVVTGVVFLKHNERGLAARCYKCQKVAFADQYTERERGVEVSPEYAAQSFVLAGMVHWYAHARDARNVGRVYE